MSDPRRVTLQDVAEVAGVSPKTVSRVVNGEPYVASGTASHVREVIRQLGFRPDQAARTLARGHRLSLAGLILPSLADGHDLALTQGVERVLRTPGYSLVITSADDDAQREAQLIADLRDGGVDSLIVLPSGAEHDHLTDAANRASLVTVHRVLDGVPADSVTPDNYGAARAASGRLLAAGHHRIAFLGGRQGHYPIDQRFEGFAIAHRDGGRAIGDHLVIIADLTAQSAAKAVTDLLDRADPPTALFAADDVTCLGVLKTLRDLRLEIPVVGFAGLPIAEHLGVPVTLLSYDQFELGSRAAQLLISRIEHGGAGQPRRVTIPVTARHVAG